MTIKAGKIAKIIGTTLSLAALAFLVFSFLRLDFTSLPFPSGVLPWVVGMGLAVAYACTVGIQGLAWRATLAFLAPVRPPVASTISVYARANIGKYLPGNVMHFVGRNYFGARLGLGHAEMAISTAFEIIALALTAIILAFAGALASGSLSLFLDSLVARRIQLILVSAAIALLVIVILAAFRISMKLRSLVTRITERLSNAVKDVRQKRYRGGVLGFLASLFSLYTLNFIIYAFIVVLAAFNFLGTPITFARAISLSTAYIASWLVGFIIPGAPGGLGVREAVFLILTGPSLGHGEALALAAISRAICFAGDGLAFLAAQAIRIPKNGKE